MGLLHLISLFFKLFNYFEHEAKRATPVPVPPVEEKESVNERKKVIENYVWKGKCASRYFNKQQLQYYIACCIEQRKGNLVLDDMLCLKKMRELMPGDYEPLVNELKKVAWLEKAKF